MAVPLIYPLWRGKRGSLKLNQPVETLTSAGKTVDIFLNYILNEFKESIHSAHSRAAEKVKIVVDHSNQDQIVIITADASGPKHINMKLGRPQFEPLTHTSSIA